MSRLRSAVKGRHYGPDAHFSRVSTDTRTLRTDDLYVALVGETFDGNDFTLQAFAKGACAAVVNDPIPGDCPVLCVADTTLALGEIARLNRLQSTARFVAITGSQGKTTVKEITGCILSVSSPVLVTKANFNNHVGVPLTLLELDETHQCAVIELGASGPGEIAYTVRMTMPHVAVITNAAATHIEGFGDLQGVVATKGEIIDGLSPDGVAVLNADDENTPTWKARAGGKKVVTFSVRTEVNAADYRATDIDLGTGAGVSFTLCTPVGNMPVTISLPGLHNVANAVAAAAASMEAGASLTEVKKGYALVKPVPGRLNILQGPFNSILIDDSYNASPSSFRAAIDVLVGYGGTRVLIVGDMGELGVQSESAHRELGEYARAHGVNALWSTGELSSLASTAFGVGGEHFADQQQLVEKALQTLRNGFVALVKGSRSAAMNQVVEKISVQQMAVHKIKNEEAG
ncbi:MAG: UDP-N-acetylmuramoyl-tripeptide--D-alanyl-D-alanine ligase [Gammaproteobacteria bacterium]|nr:UDP-N-acetylmuramoyl-tripeptide--D-alanyl-D-alanine ligase [Gammaproteobacteria bacterium]